MFSHEKFPLKDGAAAVFEYSMLFLKSLYISKCSYFSHPNHAGSKAFGTAVYNHE